MDFILKGKQYSLTKEQVEEKMRDMIPGRIQKYYALINGTKYPPKQIIAECLGIPLMEFTTMDAYGILRRLGFELKQI